MNSSSKIARTVVIGALLSGVLMTAACGNGSQSDPSAPASKTGPVTSSASAPATPAANASADKTLGIDPASIPIPADVKATFGDAASASLAHDALVFQAATESFKEIQVLPLPTNLDTLMASINNKLGSLTTPKTLADITREVRASGGTTALIPGFTPEQATNGMIVDGTTYHAIGQGVSFSHEKPVVSLNGQTSQIRYAYVAISGNIVIPAKEGVVNVATNCYYSLIPTPDGHWLVDGYSVNSPVTATPNGPASK